MILDQVLLGLREVEEIAWLDGHDGEESRRLRGEEEEEEEGYR